MHMATWRVSRKSTDKRPGGLSLIRRPPLYKIAHFAKFMSPSKPGGDLGNLADVKEKLRTNFNVDHLDPAARDLLRL
jgi:hypothetical protein